MNLSIAPSSSVVNGSRAPSVEYYILVRPRASWRLGPRLRADGSGLRRPAGAPRPRAAGAAGGAGEGAGAGGERNLTGFRIVKKFVAFASR